jgi:hypothetical protein
MKIIPLGPSAFAFEPDSDAERIGGITPERLRAHGLSESAINDFIHYRSVWSDPPSLAMGMAAVAARKAKAAE